MKTNKVMVRKMQNFSVLQRTKDSMFNANNLLNQWNNQKGNPKRDLKDFWDLKGVNDFIDVLVLEENLHGVNLPYVKSKASRGENAGTWMHPILFIKFAMWLNPRFEYFVIKFVYDELIKHRHSAGDNYKSLASSAQSLEGCDFVKIAKALNYIVFGRHDENLRQLATKDQLKELSNLQSKLAFAIDMGYIRTFDALINEMRRIWDYKYNH
jgi:hypothetical protein